MPLTFHKVKPGEVLTNDSVVYLGVDLDKTDRLQAESESGKMQIDCETCPVRGDACGDCVVTALLGPPELDEREGAALVVLADHGLISPLRDPRFDRDETIEENEERPANRKTG